MAESEKLAGSFGSLLRNHRNELGINQSELAEEIGEDPASISRWETGLTKPSKTNINAIGKVLALSRFDIEALILSVYPHSEHLAAPSPKGNAGTIIDKQSEQYRSGVIRGFQVQIQNINSLEEYRSDEKKWYSIAAMFFGTILGILINAITNETSNQITWLTLGILVIMVFFSFFQARSFSGRADQIKEDIVSKSVDVDRLGSTPN